MGIKISQAIFLCQDPIVETLVSRMDGLPFCSEAKISDQIGRIFLCSRRMGVVPQSMGDRCEGVSVILDSVIFERKRKLNPKN